MSEITSWSALTLSENIHKRRVSCVEVMTEYLAKISERNPTLNAIVGMADEQNLLDQAKTADQQLNSDESKGWLHGIPFAVKDLADLKGFVTTFGSPIYQDNVAKVDSLPIERIRDAGPIFIGKTNTPEFGLGSQSYNPVYGVTGNAFNSDWTAGGSSGGAAAALASNMLCVADGSDMMGSLRNPAAFNGVIGFRPTQGVIPLVSGDAFTARLSSAGPMGRNVADTEALFMTMAGEDLRDPYSVRGAFSATLPPIASSRIGWLGDYAGYLATEPGVLDLCESALRTLDRNVASTENCQLDFPMSRLWDAWLVLRQWSVAGKYRDIYDGHRDQLKPELIWEVEQGFTLSAWDISEANVVRSNFYRSIQKLFTKFDFLALPSAQVFPFDKSIHWPKQVNGYSMDTYHRWMEVVIAASMLGCPVINLPAGLSQDRPMGIQLIAPVGSDSKLLEFAKRYEANFN